MTSFLQLLLLLSILLLTAKLAGYAAMRFNQPSVLGKLLVGVLLGPSVLNLLAWSGFSDSLSLTNTISFMGNVGVLLLMFIAGLELQLSELRGNLRLASIAGSMGILASLLAGGTAGLIFGFSPIASFYLGLAICATSVSIAAQTLLEMKTLKTPLGLGLLSTAVFDDILALLLLSSFFAFTSATGGFGQILLALGRMLLFFVLSVLFGLWLLPKISAMVREWPVSQNILTLALIVLFAYALAAELIGQMAAITGAFLAGLMFARTPEKEILDSRLPALAYSLFVPLFFVDIGLKTAFAFHGQVIWLALVVIVLGMAAKLFGVAFGAGIAGFPPRQRLQFGAGMVARGEVSLIIASAGQSAGLLGADEFTAIVGLVLTSAIATPFLLRFFAPKDEK